MAGWGWMEGAGGDGEGSDDKDAAKKKDKGLGFSSRELGEKQNAGKKALVLVAFWMWGALLLSPTMERTPRPSTKPLN